MYINISKENKNLKKQFSGIEFYKIDGYGNLLGLIRSGNHPIKPYNPKMNLGLKINGYLNYYVNDSIFIIDHENNKFILGRDWPGNVQIFYKWVRFDKGSRLIIADNFNDMSKYIKDPRISLEGCRLFLSDRKHYHTHTIYEGVEVLHPGMLIEYDINKSEISCKYWYRPYKRITIYKEQDAVDSYRNAIDDSLSKLIPDKTQPVALMFSGGTDSTLLLERLIKLEYDKVDLFSINVIGQDEYLSSYAERTANLFEKKVNIIDCSQEETIKDWLHLLSICYHYLSDMRIDGIFAPSINVYQTLYNFYSGSPANIVWGSQYAIASPVVSSKRIFFQYFMFPLYKLIILTNSSLKIKLEELILRLQTAQVLNKEWITSDQLFAFKNLYIECLKEMKTPDELINLHLSINYNHLKHWWMYWRRQIKDEYYPDAINIYPFHDRTFQECTMAYSLFVRIGGIRNAIKMPESYKSFFLKTFQKKVPKESIYGLNKRGLPGFMSLYKNITLYNIFKEKLNECQTDERICWIMKECKIRIPKSFQEYSVLSSEEIEQLTALIVIKENIARLKVVSGTVEKLKT
jgi:hypothetical protein